jgi:hypothetical protein
MDKLVFCAASALLYGRPLRLFYSLLLSPADERLAGALVNELRHTPFMSYAIFPSTSYH